MSLSFRPFHGIRFDPKKVALSEALCPPYDVIPKGLARRLRRRRYNAIHIELPQGAADRFARSRATWRRWREAGVLVEDDAAGYYVVEQAFSFRGGRHVRTGVLGSLGLDPRTASRVLRHEKTLSKHKKDRSGLLKTVKVNTSPIFGIYADAGARMRRILAKVRRGRPAASGRDAHGIRVRVWRVDDLSVNRAIERTLSSRKLLIADGHHRYEVAREYWRRTRERGADGVLAYLAAEEDAGLLVHPTHRVLKSSPAVRRAAERLCRSRSLRGLAALERALAAARSPCAFGLVDGDYRLMTPANGGVPSRFGTDWLAKRLFRAVDPHDISYFHEAGEAVRAARRSGGVAVLVRPFSVRDIRGAVERAGLLPQKSTYFYPKIGTGIVFRSFR